MNKKILVIVGVFIIIIVGLFVKKSMEPKTTVLKVGVIAPLSGFLAEFGDATRNGILLAEKESIKNNKVQFIFEDSAYNPQKAIAAYNKLVTVDKADIIIDWGSNTTQAIAPVAKNNPNIPFISISSVTSAPAQGENIIRFFERPESFASKTWEQLRSLGYKKIAVIKTQNQWLNTVYSNLVSQAQNGESVDLVGDIASFDEKDFRTQIIKIKDSKVKYDAVGVFLLSGQIGQFYKQAGDLGLKTQTFGTDFFESQSDIDVAGKNMDGAFYAQYDVSPEFKTRFENEFKTLSQVVYAGASYDLAKVIIEGKGIKDGKTGLSYLKSINNYPGVLGLYTYKTNEADSDKYMQIQIHVKEIRDLQIKTVR